MNERIDPQTGEILDRVDQLPATIDTSMAVAVSKAQLDVQVTTARAYPRSVQTAVNEINSLATLNEQMAVECIFALPRAGKPIRGPSIRLAEIIAQCWGNCVSEARIISIDRFNKVVTAEGIFHDLQTNATTKATAERRISNKDGRIFNDDMIAVTCNAARSIARRNAILAGVPKAIWWQAYQQCEKVIAGDATTLAVNRDKAIKAFAAFGLKPEQVFALLDVKGEADVGIDEIITLRGAYAAVKNGEMSVEELLASRNPPPQPVSAAARKTLDDFATGASKSSKPEASRNPQEPSEPSNDRNPDPASEPATARNPSAESEPGKLRNPESGSEPGKRRNPNDDSEPQRLRNPEPASEPSILRKPWVLSEPEPQRNPESPSEPHRTSNPGAHSEPEQTSNPETVSEPPAFRKPELLSEPSQPRKPGVLSVPAAKDAPDAGPPPASSGAPAALRGTSTRAAAAAAAERAYVAHANAWIEEIEDADALEQRWSSEKTLRNKSNLSAEARELWHDKVVAKASKLRGR